MLEWTGERFVSWMERVQINYEHLHRYAFAASLVKDKMVLDLACGEGYGSNLLSKEAKYVAAIEIDEKAINHAINRYLRKNLDFIQGSILDVPIKGSRIFDTIICFEAIEHLDEHDKLLSEVKRLLKEDGLFIVSTPNKKIYTDEPGYQNPFHLKELYFDEFEHLLKSYFKNVHFLGQKVYSGSNLWDISSSKYSSYKEFVIEKGEREFYFVEADRKVPLYFVALASDTKLRLDISNVDSWLVDMGNMLVKDYEEQLSNTVRTKDARISELENQVGDLESQMERI